MSLNVQSEKRDNASLCAFECAGIPLTWPSQARAPLPPPAITSPKSWRSSS